MTRKSRARAVVFALASVGALVACKQKPAPAPAANPYQVGSIIVNLPASVKIPMPQGRPDEPGVNNVKCTYAVDRKVSLMVHEHPEYKDQLTQAKPSVMQECLQKWTQQEYDCIVAAKVAADAVMCNRFRKPLVKRSLAALGVVVASLAGRDALASPQDLFGYGSRATAMGATGAASAEGIDATWGNVALLSLARSRELTLGLEEAYLDLYARGGRLPGAVHPEPMRGTVIGGVLPLPFGGVLRDRVALGFGFFTPTNVVVRGRVLYPETPQFALLGDRMQSVTIQAGLGLDLGYGIRVGAGFSALAAIAGSVVVQTDTSGSVGTKVDDQLVASYAKAFGASYDFLDDYRVGVAWRSPLAARFSVAIEVHDLGMLKVPPFNIAGLAQYDPGQLAIEVARVKGRVKIAGGVTYKKWSSYPGAPEATVLCPPEQPACLALVPAPSGFHDTIVPRVGAEIDLDEGEGYALKLRFGYFYEPSPTPEQTGEANGFDNARHALTLGYGVHLSDPLPPIRVDFFSQWHQLAKRTHTKDPAVDPKNAAAPSVDTGGHVIMAGLTATVRF